MIKIVVESNSVKHQIDVENNASLNELMDAFLITLKAAGYTYVNSLEWHNKTKEDRDSFFDEEE